MDKVLGYNRKRIIAKRGIVGSHTQEEWNNVKQRYNFRCAKCGISEQELKEKWKGTKFYKLTRDHKLPIDKGGTDYIQNIWPLCISCNARKRNSFVKVCTSGYWNPAHKGHLRMIEEAARLGDWLVVIVNNDLQVKLKGSKPFMNEEERCEIMRAFHHVDEVVLSIDTDRTVRKTLEMVKPDIFAKGGDSTPDNVPEQDVCDMHNIKLVFGVGGDKIQSSSWLLKKNAI